MKHLTQLLTDEEIEKTFTEALRDLKKVDDEGAGSFDAIEQFNRSLRKGIEKYLANKSKLELVRFNFPNEQILQTIAIVKRVNILHHFST